jgi:hypothetical protein
MWEICEWREVSGCEMSKKKKKPFVSFFLDCRYFSFVFDICGKSALPRLNLLEFKLKFFKG